MAETPTPWKLYAFVASGGYAGWHAVGPKSGAKAIVDPKWSDQVITAMTGHAKLRAALEADIADLEYYIGNPSAWASYDDGMSDRLRAVVSRARRALEES